MKEMIDSNEEIENSYKKFIPVLTILFGIISIFLFVGINLEPIKEWYVYSRWGSPQPFEIFGGSYWGLVTSNFLHTELWHIGFNLYWFWFFGKKIELESGKMFFLLLVLTSAVASSTCQIAMSNTTGIGLSGILYSFFGYVYVSGKMSVKYAKYVDKRIFRLFIVWLFFCILLTQIGWMPIANAGHVGGLAWGVLLALISRKGKKAQTIIVTASLSLFISFIFWSPFSTSWLSYRAEYLFKTKRFDEATVCYQKILERNPDSEFAKQNLTALKIHKLSTQAYDLQIKEDYDNARKVYMQILKIEPQNKWAKENMDMLP